MTSPSNRARCGYTLRQSRLADIGRIHLGAPAPRSARKGWDEARSEHQPEGSVCWHHGRCLHVERRRKGERGELTITKTIWKAPLVKASQGADTETTRWNALEVKTRPSPHKGGSRAAFGLWEVKLESLRRFRFRESVKMVHRPCSEATIERERLGRSWQRQIKLATSGCGRSASSALKRRPVSGAPGMSLAEAGAGEQRRFSLSFYLAKGWRRIE